MKRGVAVAVTALLLVAAFLGLRLWLRGVAGGTLSAGLDGSRVLTAPRRLAQAGGPDARGVVDGRPVPPGPLRLDPEALGPGLHLAGFEVDYLGNPPRRVGFGILAGPFDREPRPVDCGVRVAVSQGFLDRLADRLEPALVEALAAAGLPTPRRAELHLIAAPPGLRVQVHLGFEGDSALAARIPLAVTAGEAAPLRLTRKGEVEAVVEGALETWAAIAGGGILDALESLVTHPGKGMRGALDRARATAREEAAQQVAEAVDSWLPALERRLGEAVPATLAVTLGRVEATLALTACGEAQVRAGQVLALRYHALPAVRLAPAPPTPPGLRVHRQPPAGRLEPPAALAAPPAPAPEVRPALPGGVRWPAAPLPPLPETLEGDVALALSPTLLTAALEAAWRAGALDLLLEAEAVRAPLEARLALAGGMRLGPAGLALPPALRPRGHGVALQVGELALRLEGTDRPRWLFLAGELEARAAPDRPGLVVRMGRMWAGCAPHPHSLRRVACYQEVAAQVERLDEAGGPVALDLAAAYPLGAATLKPRRLELTPGSLELTADVALPP